jgi:uncharacterized membrane protein YqjE
MAESPPGLFDSARRLLASVLATAHTRIELVAVEVEEQAHRAAELLLWSLVALAAAAFGILMLGLLAILVFWEQRVLAAAGVTAVYLLLAGTALAVIRAKARSRPRLLEQSLAELAKDRDRVGGA